VAKRSLLQQLRDVPDLRLSANQKSMGSHNSTWTLPQSPAGPYRIRIHQYCLGYFAIHITATRDMDSEARRFQEVGLESCIHDWNFVSLFVCQSLALSAYLE
jgi:hypothetical protein